MTGDSDADADDLIIEPIEEAIAMYDELLEELRKFVETHRPEPVKSRTVELATFFIGGNNEDVFQGAGYRHFASLANRPGPDSLGAFNQIIRKITQQSINTHNAMLPHLIYKISNVREPPTSNPDKLPDASLAALFDVIRPRLQLGNQLHMTFDRVGRVTIDGLERLKKQNEEWSNIWNHRLEQLEPRTVELGFNQVKGAILNLERTMMGCLRTIHTHQMRKGW
ncbi:hypothetical protein E4T48_04383 [Aureobasidium sp. EXF-10727]|nr:hypothetical protein E4T48_04383 [Aureobasidium sp. EXF-10727]